MLHTGPADGSEVSGTQDPSHLHGEASGLRFSTSLGVGENLCTIHAMHTGVKRERKKGRKGRWKGMEKVSEPVMQRAVGRQAGR